MPTRPLAPDRALPLPTRPHGRGAGGSPPAAPLGAEPAAGVHRPLPVGFPCWGSRNDTEMPSAPRIYPPAAHFRKRSGAGAFRRALRLPIHSAPAAPPAASRPRAADAGPAVPGGGGEGGKRGGRVMPVRLHRGRAAHGDRGAAPGGSAAAAPQPRIRCPQGHGAPRLEVRAPVTGCGGRLAGKEARRRPAAPRGGAAPPSACTCRRRRHRRACAERSGAGREGRSGAEARRPPPPPRLPRRRGAAPAGRDEARRP